MPRTLTKDVGHLADDASRIALHRGVEEGSATTLAFDAAAHTIPATACYVAVSIGGSEPHWLAANNKVSLDAIRNSVETGTAGGTTDTGQDTASSFFYAVSEDLVQGSADLAADPPIQEAVGGFSINLIYDAAALAAPASFRAGIQQAADMLAAAISDHITVNLSIHYSGTGHGASGGPTGGLYESYSTVRDLLVNNASPGDGTFNALPAGSTIQGASQVVVWNAELKALGLLGANDTTTFDGGAYFATDIDPNRLVAAALHELTHAMGRTAYGDEDGYPDVFDLFRFTSSGARLFQEGPTAPAAYFSIDGGNTKLADYGRTSDSADFDNNGVQGFNDPFNEGLSSSTLQHLTTVDLAQLDALGFHLNGAPTAPEIVVTGNGINIVDSDSSPSTADGTDFGTVSAVGMTVTHTFTVTNSGTSSLTTQPVSVPAGFTLVEGLSSSIAPGASDTFTVQLSTGTVGTFTGQITFTNSDSNENPFNFSITGRVNSAPTNITGSLAVNEIAANGTLVGTVVAQDADSSTFTYALLDNGGGRFAINNNGQVTVANGLLLDFEQYSSHTIVVRATDPESLFVDKTLTVTINDVNPENIVGDAANNTFVGGALADSINGGGGADAMVGRQGNDTYVVDNVGDVVTENPGEGTDTVQTNLASYTLGANVENLTFTDNGTQSGTGNDLNNVMTGGSGDDTFFAGAGSDTVIGGDGNDILVAKRG